MVYMALGMHIVSDTARLAPMNWDVKLELLYTILSAHVSADANVRSPGETINLPSKRGCTEEYYLHKPTRSGAFSGG